MEAPVPDPTVVLVEGPWRHRDVSANGTRFHVAELGDGPLVLFLHGFPQFWWTWRHQLTAVAAAGYRAVAPDLRGYGASDKPPRGYDAFTQVDDVTALVRALGERQAIVVGHDWGGLLGWAAAARRPGAIRGLAVLGMPHPLRTRHQIAVDPRGQGAASGYLFGFQVPWLPERRLVDQHAAYIGRLLHAWGGPGYPDADTERRYREAMRIPGVAHSALEYHRWVFRSLFRPDGARFADTVRRSTTVSTLHLHGALDRCMLPGTAQGSGRYVSGDYRWRLLAGVGHFPQEEVAERVTSELLGWFGSLPPSPR